MSAPATSSSSSSVAKDPQAVIAELMAQGTAVTNDYHRLQSQHAQLQADRNALLQKVAVTEAKLRRPKLPSPKPFGGDASKVDEFLYTMEQRFIYDGEEVFPVESMKVGFAAMCLETKAAQWWRAVIAKGQVIDTWEAFSAALRERFRPIDASVAARMHLDRLHMTGEVNGYTELVYKNLLQIPDMGVADQIHAYIRGLKDYLRVEVLKANPKTLSEAVNKAKLAEAYFGMQKGGRGLQSYGRSAYVGGNHGAGNSGTAMDISNINQESLEAASESEYSDFPQDSESALLAELREMRIVQQQQQQFIASMFQQRNGSNKGNSSSASSSGANRAQVPNVSKADYERCRREGRCLKCKEKGNHIARDCKKPFSSNF